MHKTRDFCIAQGQQTHKWVSSNWHKTTRWGKSCESAYIYWRESWRWEDGRVSKSETCSNFLNHPKMQKEVWPENSIWAFIGVIFRWEREISQLCPQNLADVHAENKNLTERSFDCLILMKQISTCFSSGKLKEFPFDWQFIEKFLRHYLKESWVLCARPKRSSSRCSFQHLLTFQLLECTNKKKLFAVFLCNWLQFKSKCRDTNR